MRAEYGCQIILNGVLPTIKYYLRLIHTLESFMKIYLNAIQNDNEIQQQHKQRCNALIQQLGI